MDLSCSRRGLLHYLSWRWAVRPLISLLRVSASPRKLTRSNVAQQECPCRKRPGSVRGKTSPIFPSFASKLSRTALTYSLGPGFGWHGSFGLLAATQPCRVELRNGRSSWQRRELPCSSQLFQHSFFHLGAPPCASVKLGEAELVFLSISISQSENCDDRCVSGPPSFFTPGNTVCDIPGSAPVSAQPAPAYTQTPQASDIGQAQTALPLTLQYAQLELWEITRFNSASGCNVLGAGLGPFIVLWKSS